LTKVSVSSTARKYDKRIADTTGGDNNIDPKAAIVSRRKPPWNVLNHKPPPN